MTAQPDYRQILERIVRPTLQYLDAADPGQWSTAVEQLMMGTLVQESGGVHVYQLAGGPALSWWQVEPETHDDIWDRWLHRRPNLRGRIETLRGDWPPQGARHLVNPYYGLAIARQRFRMVPERMPYAGDVDGLARYYKAHFNTPLGRATDAAWAAGYRREIAPLFERRAA